MTLTATLTAARRRADLLQRAMRRVGFSATAVEALLGAPDPRLTAPEQEALWTWRARGDDPLAQFTRLYVLGHAITTDGVRAVFGDAMTAARRAGLLQTSARGTVGGLALSVHDGVVIASDAAQARPARDHVQGPTRATMVIEAALPPSPRGRLLELGTGAGYLAIRLALAAQSNLATVGRQGRGQSAPGLITATDVSARAIGHAALSAALAGLDARAITWALSDRFAALDRRPSARFDLIVGNLPFVISSHARFSFRDSGLPDDDFVASVVSHAGRYLREGGQALLLGQWIHRADEAEDQRLAPWFVAAGCDAVVLRLDLETPEIYAARWSAGLLGALDRPQRLRLIERQVVHLHRARVTAISTGLFVLRRRRADRHLMAIDDVPAAAPPLRWSDLSARLDAFDRHL